MTGLKLFSPNDNHAEALKDTESFASLIHGAINHYGVKPADMARKFGVNPSTIGRWAAGKNAPHVMVRPIIIDWIREYVQEEIRKVARKIECDEAEESGRQRRREAAYG